MSLKFVPFVHMMFFLLLPIFCTLPNASLAQETVRPNIPQNTAPDPNLIIDGLVNALDEITAEKEAGGFLAREEYYKALINFYHFQEDMRTHTRRVLTWQIIASYLILALVLTVTGLGGFLSYREVMKALSIGFSPEHRLDVAANRFQVTSAITGVVILVLSLFFLLLFVERVFQVNPIRMSDGDSLVSGSGKPTSTEKNSPTIKEDEKESGMIQVDGQPSG